MASGSPKSQKENPPGSSKPVLPMIDYDPDDRATQNLVDVLEKLNQEKKSRQQK